MFFSSAKEKKISKSMSNIYYWKNWRYQNLKKCNRFEEQKRRRYIRVCFGIIVFVYKSVSQIFGEIKGFYQSTSGNDVDFADIINISSNILAKLRHGFVDEKVFFTQKSIFYGSSYKIGSKTFQEYNIINELKSSLCLF